MKAKAIGVFKAKDSADALPDEDADDDEDAAAYTEEELETIVAASMIQSMYRGADGRKKISSGMASTRVSLLDTVAPVSLQAHKGSSHDAVHLLQMAVRRWLARSQLRIKELSLTRPMRIEVGYTPHTTR